MTYAVGTRYGWGFLFFLRAGYRHYMHPHCV
jgi:hypothetical protein